MIRDPSDGSVRQPKTYADDPRPSEEIIREDRAAWDRFEPGLPIESTKPDRKERLDKSREWLKQYFKRNPEQGT